MKRSPVQLSLLFVCLLSPLGLASGAAPGSTSGATSATLTAAPQDEGATITRDLRWRNIGPGNMMGRIASIDGLNTDHRTVLVASASGGVFLSHNAGVTWDPIFDSSGGAGSIGAAVLFQGDPDVIWVGTGEAANRNSSGWGDGVWRTTDAGATWTHVGLEDTHHIAEIATHPTDPDIAYVASPGHLWGYSGDRGLWRTRDGGDSWEKLTTGLPDDGKTGATEVILHPDDPNTIFAGFYHRIRGPATMFSGGEAGGIFKSTDGGDSWTKVTAGLPAVTGMIDIEFHLADPSIVVAAVEAEDDIPWSDDAAANAANPGGGIYISRDGGDSWSWSLKTITRPFYHGQVSIDPLDPDRIYSVGREFRVSRDGGESWGNRWWGGGGDDHDLWIAPYDGGIRYTATDQGAYLTTDDGDTVLAFENMAIGQYYKVGVDMRDPYWVGGGLQDNALWIGPSNSREGRGILNMHHTWLAEGDGFQLLVDPTDHRTVYGVNHVGFAVRMDVETRDYHYITPTPETIVNYDEHFEPGYDEVAIDYTIDPGEHWFFRRPEGRPLLPPQFRFNWNAPLEMSPSNPDTLYFGGNHVFKSVDRGDTWRIISPDLSRNDPDLRNPSQQGGLTRSVTGGENHFTLFAIAESPLDPAEVWAGTDDGFVWVTRDGGVSWNDVRGAIPGLPDWIQANSIVASAHAPGRAYVVFDNHRLDDFTAYVYRTDDWGASWSDVSGDLPDGGSSYVLVEDPRNPRLLYVGTEFGVWVTVDSGEHWSKLDTGMPTVAAYDLVLHPRDYDLVVGTHGRSIWILDDTTPLQQMGPEIAAQDAWLFRPRRATDWVRIDLGRKQPDFIFRGENPPSGALLHFWLGESVDGPVELRVEDPLGERSAIVPLDAHAGLNRARWDLEFPSTLRDRRNARERLLVAIRRLEGRVGGQESQARLTELASAVRALDLEAAPEAAPEGEGGFRRRPITVDDRLNGLRQELVDEFGAWAGGRPLFGPQIASSRAEPGRYRVVLRVGDREWTRTLELRADPMRQP